VKKILGWILILSPFLAILGYVIMINPIKALIALGCVVIFVACLLVGLEFIK
jgi:hypothetical protein